MFNRPYMSAMNVTDRKQFLSEGNPVEELTVEGSRFDRISILVDDGSGTLVVRAREVGSEEFIEERFDRIADKLFKPVVHAEKARREVDDDIQDAVASIGYAPVDDTLVEE